MEPVTWLLRAVGEGACKLKYAPEPEHFEAARHDGLADQAGGRAAAPESQPKDVSIECRQKGTLPVDLVYQWGYA